MRAIAMMFIALAKFKKSLSKEVVEQNMKDIETDTEGQIKYLGIYWTLGRYDTVVMFEALDEKAAMNMVLRRADRMDIEMLVAVPADESHPSGPV
ncbi:GYD domain-containing protein [Methanoplanus endosymbiosus]|uniref:GYD domain-containing protein n=1 Tax=Methanoplanus endosymbiosus TaxID=33865 RepID=A0A9E7TL32_9EURY|nr:GYD domain-containing protein [Methanoplanus endosymbiosus]UUX93285.1 GYD domain-containing protein [Methanoplanus endosymbiosus]